MQPHVNGEFIPVREGSVAGEAHRCWTLGSSFVLSEVLSLDKRSSTGMAGEGAFPCVQAQVVTQVAGVEEALATE